MVVIILRVTTVGTRLVRSLVNRGKRGELRNYCISSESYEVRMPPKDPSAATWKGVRAGIFTISNPFASETLPLRNFHWYSIIAWHAAFRHFYGFASRVPSGISPKLEH